MKKIALIPIDNRPVCYTLPKMITDINEDIELLLPNRKLLGSLTQNANINALFEWLDEIKNVDFIVICADTLLYGGLIPSRRTSDTKEILEQRIIKLRNILLKKDSCKTFLFSSIMRISNNNINEEEKEYWSNWGEKIFAYSYNLHRFEIEGDSSAKQLAKDLAKEIPNDILIDWLTTRERNFSINKMLLKLYDDKIIDTLVYSKDDCAKYGFNVKEAKFLEYEAEKRQNVFVKTGADERPLTLLSRCLSCDKKIKIAPVYTNPNAINEISKYEDISVENSVKSQILTAGAEFSTFENADLIMYVNNFKNHQGEIVMDIETENFSGTIQTFDKPYFIIDILNANGADNNFIKKLKEKINLNNFYGYSAWNTTGNSLGGGIAAAISKFLSKKINEETFKKLQLTRFLDDWAYQANIRQIIKSQNIQNQQQIKELFKPYENEIKNFLKNKDYEIKYSFPWNRYFEIEIEI